MLAARANQENAIYEQQQAAAAKPLNQGIKGLAPKTPSNKQSKTPFGKPRGDENATVAAPKYGKPERNVFVTPANPRTRAPLGNKTTNAKTFQTPAPLLAPGKEKGLEQQSSAKPTSPRLRRSRIKVHESASLEIRHDQPEDPEDREIEYMAPRGVPLPDVYDDFWPHECEFPKLDNAEITRGCWSEFAPGKDEDDPELSDYDEKCRQAEEHNKKKSQTKREHLSKNVSSVSVKSGPSAMAARSAAKALSGRSMTTPATTVAPVSTSITSRKPPATSFATKKPMFDRGNPRFTAAKAASNSTIGYSKGRVVSTSRRPLTDIHGKPQDSRTADSNDKKTTLDILLSLGSLDVNDEDAGLGFLGASNDLDHLIDGDEEDEVFQLDPVKES